MNNQAPQKDKDKDKTMTIASPPRKSMADPSPTAKAKRPGMHSFTASSTLFTIDTKYHPRTTLGAGAYGVVISAVDKTNGRKVAIKKITRAFQDLVDAKRILREIKLLRHFKHENVIGLLDMVDPPSLADFEDIYIVLEFMETDLHKIIYSKNVLTDDHIQFFVYQILSGLKYIHSANVIHRDLKPSNLLLNSDCELKICDFGLARGIKTHEHQDYDLTEYVVTRWYRAPEIMCSCQEYDFKIDVWAVGCIFAELLQQEPMFPGEDYIHQMNLIFETLGTPEPKDMVFVTNENALAYIKGIKKKPKKNFRKLFPKANPLAVDLVEKMLTFNPIERISVEEALRHPYLKDLYEDLDNHKQECKENFDFEFEKIPLTKPTLKKLMFDEICYFRPYLKQNSSSSSSVSQST